MAVNEFVVLKHPFKVDAKFQFIRELGVGAYGVVCAAKDTELGINVAIKKIGKIFEKKILAKRTLRELKLLKHFTDHENIISVLDVLKPTSENYEEIYLIQELMEADMHQIIRSQQPLTDAHFQYFLYQILRGLKFIHSANVLHRDLKPGNLLVNADCELKICDFGLARGFTTQADANAGFMTEYVATRWYRAPEIMLSFLQYTKAIDIWSVGCIFAEMLGGKVLFAGKDFIHQLNLILQILGTVPDETLNRIGSKRAQAYVRHLPFMAKVPFSKLYPKATPVALDLLEKLLDFDPARRITVEEALAHPYLETYHDADDEPTCAAFNFDFESKNKMGELKQLISEEIMTYHNLKRPAVRRQSSKQVLTDPGTLEKAEGNKPVEGINYVQNKNAAQESEDSELERELEQGVQKLGANGA